MDRPPNSTLTAMTENRGLVQRELMKNGMENDEPENFFCGELKTNGNI